MATATGTTGTTATRGKLNWRARRRLKSVVMHVLAVAVTIVMLLPLTWIFATSIRPLEDVIAIPVQVIPTRFTIQPYFDIWDAAPFLRFSINSLAISVATAAIGLTFSTLAAYAFVRFRFWGSRLLLIFVLVSQALPGTSILLPLF